ncbi:MAG TPA: nucleoside hydrolase [Calidithermus sp.]|nr:nucleoside hydrolase [Calidithermus sp.]
MIGLAIDTDPGVDDALALLLAWGSPEARVTAVTVVAGNVPLEACLLNVFRLLALRRPEPVPPVAAGARQPLRRRLRTAESYHGRDGLGDLEDWPPVAVEPQAFGAPEALVDLFRARGPELTLVALGPLTNVALALDADAPAMRRARRVVVMGGAVDVPGNVTPAAEFNFHVDPDAAARVLEAGLPLDLVPLDATRQAVVERETFEAALTRRPGELADRVARFSARPFAREGGRLTLHDPLAVAAALDETLVEWEPVRLAVGRDGETRRTAGPPNCRLATRVDTARFLRQFLDRVAGPACGTG